jgi:predicted nucleic acid-binding protein
MKPVLFVDSWGWVVLANQKESGFELVKSLYENEIQGGGRIVTSDYILDEVITFLYAKTHSSLATQYIKSLFSSIDLGIIHLERITTERFEKAWKMRLKYEDHPKISFTDFTSFVVMKDLHIRHVLTHDHHFEHVNLGFQKLP